MKNIFKDIWSVVSSMSFIDFVLYFAVIVLIVLIVSLIYVIYMEKLEEQMKDDLKEKPSSLSQSLSTSKPEKSEDFDLLSIIDEINENPEPLIDMTAYEEEQERRAIISYDELLKTTKKEINYDKEELVDNVIPVKKISLSDFELPNEISYIPKEPKIEIEEEVVQLDNNTSGQLFRYEKEEAFLRALQQLNEILN